MIGVVIVAHAPLASSLMSCASHVFGQLQGVEVYDADSDRDPKLLQQELHDCIARADTGDGVLVLTDVAGATPYNQAEKVVREADQQGRSVTMLAGVNLPMLLRTLPYRHLSLDDLAQRALTGGTQGVLRADCSSHEG